MAVMVLLGSIVTRSVFPHLWIVFVDAYSSFGASALFEDESLPWVASEPPKCRSIEKG